jgi:hypothetical protein
MGVRREPGSRRSAAPRLAYVPPGVVSRVVAQPPRRGPLIVRFTSPKGGVGKTSKGTEALSTWWQGTRKRAVAVISHDELGLEDGAPMYPAGRTGPGAQAYATWLSHGIR